MFKVTWSGSEWKWKTSLEWRKRLSSHPVVVVVVGECVFLSDQHWIREKANVSVLYIRRCTKEDCAPFYPNHKHNFAYKHFDVGGNTENREHIEYFMVFSVATRTYNQWFRSTLSLFDGLAVTLPQYQVDLWLSVWLVKFFLSCVSRLSNKLKQQQKNFVNKLQSVAMW